MSKPRPKKRRKRQVSTNTLAVVAALLYVAERADPKRTGSYDDETLMGISANQAKWLVDEILK